MKKIDLIPGTDHDDTACAFCREAMDNAGIDGARLSKVIAASLQPFAPFLRNGMGMALIVKGDRADIIGIQVDDEGGADE